MNAEGRGERSAAELRTVLREVYGELMRAAVSGVVSERQFQLGVGRLGLVQGEQDRLRGELARLGVRVRKEAEHASQDQRDGRMVAPPSAVPPPTVAAGRMDVAHGLLHRYQDGHGRVAAETVDGVARLCGLTPAETRTLRDAVRSGSSAHAAAGTAVPGPRGEAAVGRVAALGPAAPAVPTHEAPVQAGLIIPVPADGPEGAGPLPPAGEPRAVGDVGRAVEAARALLDESRFIRRPESRLLSAQEEVGLGALVRGGADRLDREVTEEEIAALPATDIRVRARDRFVVHNQRLVHSIVPKYLEQGLDYEDLFQHGARGLIKAAVKFDPTQGYKFSTYATWWIRQALTRAVANEGSVIRVPVHMHEQMRKVALAERKLQSQGRSTRPADVAVACDMPVQRVEEIRLLSRRTDSLDRIVGDGAHLGDLVALDRPLPSAEQLVMEQLHHAYLLSFLDRFGEREARILLRRTGLDDGERSTLDDLGKEFGVTRERIRQVEVKAFEALRQMLREAGFGPGHDEVPDPEPRKRATRAQRAARAARAACAAEAARAVRAARAARVARFAEAAGAAQAVGAAGGDLAGAADAAGDGVALAAQAGGRGAGQAIVPPVPGTQGAGGEPGAGQDLVVQPHAARTEDGPSTGVRQAAPAAAPVPDPVPVTALGSAATPGCEPGPETVAAPEPVPAPVPGAAPVSGAVAAGAPVRECGAGEAHAADWERALAIPVQFSGSVAWLSEYALLALGYEELAQVLGRAAADDVVAVLKRRGTLDRPVVTALEVLQKVFDSLKAAGRRPADFLDRSFQALNGASPRSYLAQRPLASRESRLAVRSALREFTQTPAAPAASDAVAGPGVAGPAVTALPVASVEAPEGTGAAETPAATGTAAEPEHATTAATSAAAPSAPAETATVQDPRAGHSAAEWNAALDAEAERRLDELEAALLGRVDRALQRRERSLHREYDARAARLREEADVRLRREREEHQVQTAALMVRLQQAEARTADAEECAAQAGARAARAEERAAQADARVEEAGRQYRTQLNSLEEQLRGARFEVAQRETALRQAEDDAAAATEAVERWAAHRIAETEAATRDAHRWIAELEAQLTALTEAPERRTLRDMWRRS